MTRPSDRAELATMRRYLRKVDLVGGYIPQLAMTPDRTRVWTEFWFAVRRLDDLADQSSVAAVGPLVAAMRRGAGDEDFQRAMRSFVDDAAPWMSSRQRMIEMLGYLDAERAYLALGARAKAVDLFRLWYHKAYIPAYVGMRLLLDGEDDARVRTYAKLVGAGFQFCDDLIDVVDDVRAGLFWITGDELEELGLRRSELLHHTDALTSLRETICLRYFLAAWDLAAEMSPRNRRLAELTIEQFFRCVLKGRFHPYPGPRKNYYGLVGAVLPRIGGPEAIKYAILHRAIRAFARLPLRLASPEAARRRSKRSRHAVPAALEPAVCLRVMAECEEEPRRWTDVSDAV